MLEKGRAIVRHKGIQRVKAEDNWKVYNQHFLEIVGLARDFCLSFYFLKRGLTHHLSLPWLATDSKIIVLNAFCKL